jgi:predicted transcriptional regulator
MKNELILSKKGKLPISGTNSLENYSPRRGQYKLCLRKTELKENMDFNEKIAWICSSFAFFEEIDKNKLATRIFREIFLAGTMNQVLTSTSIAQRIGMSRGSVINHLNNLLDAGLIEKGGKYYFVRAKTMKMIVEEVEDDTKHIFSRIKKIAEEIDKETDDVIRM